MTPAYKHLEARTRIGELTLGQWAGLLVGALCAIAVGGWLRPFSGYLNVALALYVGGLPAGAVYLASASEFDAWLTVRAWVSWYRREGRHLPGPGKVTSGYVVLAGRENRGGSEVGEGVRLELGALWVEREETRW